MTLLVCRLFDVDDYDAAAQTIGWTKGGFQGARGNKNGGQWYISNGIVNASFFCIPTPAIQYKLTHTACNSLR